MGMGVEGSNPPGAGTLIMGCCCSSPCTGRGGRQGPGLGTAAVEGHTAGHAAVTLLCWELGGTA